MADGDIGAILDDEEFDGGNCVWSDIVHISGVVYAIVYQGVGDDGWIKTVTISAAGVIAMVGGGSLEFDTDTGMYPKIIHISGDVYAIVYQGAGTSGFIKTVTITSAGAIALVGGGSLEFDTGAAYWPDIIHISGDVYAVAYADAGILGKIKTVTISAAGAIAAVGGGSLEFESDDCRSPDIIHISGDVYAIAYRHYTSYGWIKTVTISDVGAIALVSGGSLNFDDTGCAEPEIIHISGAVYAVVYEGLDDDGWIKTVTISDVGAIALVGGGSLEFDATFCSNPDIIHISGDKYVIAYTIQDGTGLLIGLTISAAGAISLTAGNTLVFNASKGAYGVMLHVTGNVYAISHQGTDDDGWIVSFDTTTAGAGAIQHIMMMGVG